MYTHTGDPAPCLPGSPPMAPMGFHRLTGRTLSRGSIENMDRWTKDGVADGFMTYGVDLWWNHLFMLFFFWTQEFPNGLLVAGNSSSNPQVMASRYSSHILILIYHFNFRLLKFPLPPGHVFHYGQDANTRHLVSIESAIASYSSLVVSEKMPDSSKMVYWLVVSTPTKNISQLGSLSPIYWKIKNVNCHFHPIFPYGCVWKRGLPSKKMQFHTSKNMINTQISHKQWQFDI